MREAFGVVDHNDGLSTDDEQNNLETATFNSTRGIYLLCSTLENLPAYLYCLFTFVVICMVVVYFLCL